MCFSVTSVSLFGGLAHAVETGNILTDSRPAEEVHMGVDLHLGEESFDLKKSP